MPQHHLHQVLHHTACARNGTRGAAFESHTIVSTLAPLGNKILRSMGMIITSGSWYILATSTTGLPPIQAKEDSDDESSDSDSLLSSATTGPSTSSPVVPLRHRLHIQEQIEVLLDEHQQN